MSEIIIAYNTADYVHRWERLSKATQQHGAYNYSKEIVNNIIPRVKTERPWVTINQPFYAKDHAIVFVHGNLHPDAYDWFRAYRDTVMVAGMPETAEVLKSRGHKQVIYLPLSIDVGYVQKFKRKKTRAVAYAGRPEKKKLGELPEGIDLLEGLERDALLAEMAKYKQVYAVGRTAIEARALGCEILPFDHRFPDPSVWRVVDNCEAAEILQRELDKIDGKTAPDK